MTDDDDLDLLDQTVTGIEQSPRRWARAGIPLAPERGDAGAHTARRRGSCRAPDNAVDPAGLLGFLTHRDAARRQRRRTFAVGTATAVLAGAAVFWIGVEPLGPPPTSATPPVAAPIETWNDRAQVTLVSIASQLEQIDQTTQVWNTQIADQYQNMPTPAPVAAMLARKVLLEQQRAILTSELATAHELDQARTDLATLDQQIATLSAALATSTPSNTAAGQADAVVGLQEARTLAEQMRTAKQAEVDRLTAGLRRAEQTPMPDRIDRTTPLTRAVLSLDTHRHPDPSHPGIPGQTPPGMAPGGTDGRRAAQQVTTGQPVPPRSEPLPVDPTTRGPDGKSSTGIGAALTHAATGAARTLDSTAQKLLTPDGGRTDIGVINPGHRGHTTKNTPDDPVAGATHSLTGAVNAVGDTAEHLITPAASPHTSDNHPRGNRSTGTAPSAGARTAAAAKTVGGAAGAATHTVTGTVDAVGGAAQNVLGGSSAATGSGAATGRHRAASAAVPTRSSAGSQAAQLQSAEQIVRSVPDGTWASSAIALAQQVANDSGPSGAGSSADTTSRSDGGSDSTRTSSPGASGGYGGAWGSSWSAHSATSATGSTSSKSSASSSSSSERTSSSSASSGDTTGSATGGGGASSESSGSGDGGASS